MLNSDVDLERRKPAAPGRMPAAARGASGPLRRLSAVATLCALATGCQPTGQPSAPAILTTYASPHQAHAAWLTEGGMDETRAGRMWLSNAASSVLAPVEAPLPYLEEGWFRAEEGLALGYRVRVGVGQKVTIRIEDAAGRPAPFFVDAFAATDLPASPTPAVRPVALALPTGIDPASIGPNRVRLDELPTPSWSADLGELVTEFEPPDSGTFVLRLQPRALAGGRYRVTLISRAVLHFPVADRDTRAIQSFWGAPRSGRRRHEGVDIFAPRHTPVVASAPGRVSRVEVTNLGGNVVWLRDSQRNQSLYYAHLQEQWVEEGDQVEIGDTLGTVGNSGNARTTPPHLHYGIYRRGRGAVNPYPYLRHPSGSPEALDVDEARFGEWIVAQRDGLRLRSAPSTRADAVTDLPLGSPLRVVAGSGDWFRVLTREGRTGFVLGRLTTEYTPDRAVTAQDQGVQQD